MSMKRSKQSSATGGTRRPGEGSLANRSPLDPLPEPEKSWDELVDGKPEEVFVPYDMKQRYDKGALVAHSKFGRGAVVGVETGHIDVVFQDTKRKLGHGRS